MKRAVLVSLLCALTVTAAGGASGLAPLRVTVRADRVVERYRRFWGGVGYDPFKSGTLWPENRAFFTLLSHTPGVLLWQRAHNIFTTRGEVGWADTGGNVYSEDPQGRPRYNFEVVDEVFDVVTAAGLTPIVELGFMPEALAAREPRTLRAGGGGFRTNWGGGVIAYPRDYRRWGDLVARTVRHLQQRYGRQRVEGWYFEVWNEPDLWEYFWLPAEGPAVGEPDPSGKHVRADLREYCRLYDYSVQAVKSVNPRLRVGGPALAGWPYFWKGFLEHVVRGTNYATGGRGSPLEFVSFHSYGSIEGLRKKVRRCVAEMLAVSERLREVEVHLNEYGPTTRRKGWCGGHFEAAWNAAAVVSMFQLGDELGPVYRPDLMVWWGGPASPEFKGGFAGFLPAERSRVWPTALYNSFLLLARLGEERLAAAGPQPGGPLYVLATRNSEQAVQVLLVYLDDEGRDRPGLPPLTVQLTVEGLSASTYRWEHLLIDQTHSNPKHYWQSVLGRRASLTAEEEAALTREAALQRPEPLRTVTPARGALSAALRLEPNSVHLVVLSPLR